MTGDPLSSPESVPTDLAGKTLVGCRWWGLQTFLSAFLTAVHSLQTSVRIWVTVPTRRLVKPGGFLDLLNLIFNCMQIQIKSIISHNGCIHYLPRKRKWPCYSGQYGEVVYLALNQWLRISYISVSRVSQARSPLPSIWSPLGIFGTTFPNFKNITHG